MSYTPTEAKEIRGTAAFELMRHMMLQAIAVNAERQYSSEPKITVEELNKVLLVAGIEMVTPSEVLHDLDVINFGKEDAE